MQLTFTQLQALKSAGLTLSSLQVALFLKENGRQDPLTIAKACGISERSVYVALRALKKISHDLRSFLDLDLGERRTAQTAAAPAQESAPRQQETAPASADCPQEPADPLEADLVALGIFPEQAPRLIAQAGREAIAQQVAFHRFRLAHGFKFRKAPAAMLYAACKTPEKFPAPEGFHAAAYQKREGIAPARPVAVTPARAEEAPAVELTPEERAALRVASVREMIEKAQAIAEPMTRRRSLEMARKVATRNGINFDTLLAELSAAS